MVGVMLVARPIWAKAAMAAASVTRTASSAKERSRGFSWAGGRVSVMGFLGSF